jgi:phosphohistidine phosphatase
MKTLYLVRHAKSSWEDPYQKDIVRPLNKRGKRDAPKMGKRLKEKHIHPDLIVTSPAERALTTSILMAQAIGYAQDNINTDKKLYHAGPEQILTVIRKLSERHQVVFVYAHNPGITEFANKLSTESFITDNIPTCGVVAFRIAIESWKDVDWKTGEMEFYDYPKNKQG